MPEQITFFEETEERPSECCYSCKHFAEFKQPRTFTDRDSEVIVYGMCCKSFCKNGSYYMYPIYVPEGRCKDYKKGAKNEQ